MLVVTFNNVEKCMALKTKKQKVSLSVAKKQTIRDSRDLDLLLPLRLIAGSKFIEELAVHLHKCF